MRHTDVVYANLELIQDCDDEILMSSVLLLSKYTYHHTNSLISLIASMGSNMKTS